MRSPTLLRGPGLLGLCLGAAFSMAPLQAEARCDSDVALHACVNADSLWLSPKWGRFLMLGSTESLNPGSFALATSTTVISRPVVLRVPSPSSPLEVAAVDKAVHLGISASVGLAKNWELGGVIPLTLYQSGAGVRPYLSSNAEMLPSAALRDPRLGSGFTLVTRDSGSDEGFAMAARIDVSLPIGDEEAFASEPGPAFAPALTAEYRSGALPFGAEAGARLRTATDFATARFGSQAVFAFDMAADVMDDALSFGIEAMALPVLLSQPTGEALVPAEWMATARSVPFSNGNWAAMLGAGTALPLPEAAMTAPAWRAVFSIQYNTNP